MCAVWPLEIMLWGTFNFMGSSDSDDTASKIGMMISVVTYGWAEQEDNTHCLPPHWQRSMNTFIKANN